MVFSCRAVAAIAGGVLLGACSPALDWRELRPDGMAVQAVFPCKPDRHARSVPLAGEVRRMELLSCSADGATWGLSVVEVAEPAQVGPVLDALAAAARSNLQSQGERQLPLAVPGMTPASGALRLALEGRTPDGGPLRQQVAVFARGLRVYQATVIGNRVGDDAADTFFGGLVLPP